MKRVNKVREFIERGLLRGENLAKLRENKGGLLKAGIALQNCLFRERRLAKLRERYAMNNKGTGVSDAHR